MGMCRYQGYLFPLAGFIQGIYFHTLLSNRRLEKFLKINSRLLQT